MIPKSELREIFVAVLTDWLDELGSDSDAADDIATSLLDKIQDRYDVLDDDEDQDGDFD